MRTGNGEEKTVLGCNVEADASKGHASSATAVLGG